MNCEKCMEPAWLYESWYLKDPKDHYILHKRLYKKLTRMSGALLAVCLLLMAVFGTKLNTMRPGVKKVPVYVAMIDSAGSDNKVYVFYNDKRDEVLDVPDSEIYRYEGYQKTGSPIEVYLGDDGKLYSYANGFKNRSAIGKLYFASLYATLALIFCTAILAGFVIEANRHERGIYPKNYRRR